MPTLSDIAGFMDKLGSPVYSVGQSQTSATTTGIIDGTNLNTLYETLFRRPQTTGRFSFLPSSTKGRRFTRLCQHTTRV